MCEGRRFQADGAATEKELFESWRLDRGTIKSPQNYLKKLIAFWLVLPYVSYIHNGGEIIMEIYTA